MLLRTLSSAAVLAASLATLTAFAHDPAPAKPAPAPKADAKAEPKAEPKAEAKAEPKADTWAPGTVLARGEKLQGLPAVKLAELVKAPDGYQGKSVRVEGTVRRACNKMGCWMELAESTSAKAAGIRVIMKDHAFFVPTDSAGSKATIEGTVSVETLAEGDVN